MDRHLGARQLAGLLGPWRDHPQTSAYEALASAIELLVLDGRLPAGTRLPAERDLAQAIATSRTTVSTAYARLRQRGFVQSRRGSGSRTTLPTAATPGTTAILPSVRDDVLDLACAAAEAPPGLAPAVTAAAQALPAFLAGHGYEPQGIPSLREIVAAAYTDRGLPTTPDQILITGGALQALALALRAFAEPGDKVLVEHPSFPNALEAISREHARRVPVPLGADGWDTEAIVATVRQAAPRLAYLIADFHNPTGALLDAESRVTLADAFARSRTLPIVDETLVDLPLDVEPDAMPAPFAACDERGQTVLIGSTSKSYWGGIRVGWLRAPTDLVPTLVTARATLDLGTPVLSQLIAAHVLANPEPILTERRETLRRRRHVLTTALQTRLPDWRFTMPLGGLGIWCELPAPVSSVLATLVTQHGVRLAPGPRFGIDGTLERFIRLPYTLPEAELDDAVQRVAAAYAVVADSESAAGTPDLSSIVA